MSKGFRDTPFIPGGPPLPPNMGAGPQLVVSAPLNDVQLMMLMAAHIHAARVIGEPQSPDDPATAIDAKDSKQITVSALIAMELFGNVLILNQETPALGQMLNELRKRFHPTKEEEPEQEKKGRAADRMAAPVLVTDGEQGA